MEKWMQVMRRADFNGLAQRFGLDPVTIRLMVNRGVNTEEKIERFLYADWRQEYDPYQMKGAEKAADMLQQAIRRGEKIRIASDFDVDGIFSGQILYEGIRACGGDVSVKAPNRVKEGYGVNAGMMEAAAEDGVGTVITCDNGIAAFEAIRRAKELGLTVIVTDHHECQYEEKEEGRVLKLPEADVIVNPHQPDCSYPFEGLCGAGVAYKVIRILYEKCGIPREESLRLLEYVGIATVADVMDLVDENRIFVKEGLARLMHTENAGLRALIRACGLEGKTLTAYHIGFILGPCFNSAGRLDTVDIAFGLLRSTEAAAYPMAEKLREMNESRKGLTRQGEQQAIAWVESQPAMDDVLVIPLPDLHESVAGIVAGRIRERYHHPVIVLTRGADGFKGSGRSIPAWNMFEGLMRCRPLMTKFGGHPMAAGLSLPEENIDLLREQINAETGLTEDDFIPIIRIDVPMPIGYITEERIREFSLLEPCGKGNTKPLFAESRFHILWARILGKNRNVLRMTVENEQRSRMDALYFGDIAAWEEAVRENFGVTALQALYGGRPAGVTMSLAYYPEVNEYMGRRSLQIVVEHWRVVRQP